MKKFFCTIVFFIGVVSSFHAQDVIFNLANPQITGGGSSYEVDVLISSSATFKLGSGQLYFNYNTSAFGTNVVLNNRVTITQPSGSILATNVGFPFYNSFLATDNSTSRFSFAWQQALSSSCLVSNNITGTDQLLFHIKLDFTGSIQTADLCFHSIDPFDNQIFTACGPETGNCTFASCATYPGTQITNDFFNCSGGVLPIELTTFNVEKTGKSSALLTWGTLSESTSSHFEIERSINGVEWSYISQVEATGNSFSEKKYEFLDKDVYSSEQFTKIFYYRLKIVDLDNQYEYSPIRNVIFSSDSVDKVRVFPNPSSSGILTLQIDNHLKGEILISIVDKFGQTVKILKTQKEQDLVKISITVSSLPSGCYSIILTGKCNAALSWIKV